MKILTTILLVFLISHFSFLILPTAQAAEQTLRVSPVIVNVSLSPGKTYTHEVSVENLTNAPMPLRAELNDFMTSSEEGGYVFEETADNPLLSWIKLSETEMILGPQEKKTIIMTIQTPKSIPLGGYYGVLFFEPVLQNDFKQSTRVSSKVGVLMLANVGVPDPNAEKAEVLAFETPLLDSDGTVPMMLRVKNISLNFFTAKPILTLSPLLPLSPPPWARLASGGQSPSVTFEDKVVFPGKIRRWTEDKAVQNLSPNFYKATMAVSVGNGESVTVDKLIIIFPYERALIVIAALLITGYIIIKRKRLGAALKELIR